MNVKPKFAKLLVFVLWFCLFCAVLGLRFWGLGRFPTFIFDESIYARLAQKYLAGTAFFHNHPPLGKYLIALGIGLGGFNPVGCRWLNALLGSAIPFIVGAIAYQLSQRQRYALLATGLSAVDGLLLVESRYALLNIYIVFFGLLGQWFCIRSLTATQRKIWLLLGGLSLGAAAAVKWSGLSFTAGIAGVLLMLKLRGNPPFARKIRIWQLGFFLGIIPLASYTLLWLPHLALNPGSSLWQIHQQMLQYHQTVSTVNNPYCSAWYTWPWMFRPVSYFHQISAQVTEQAIVYDVRAMGNPVLWGLGSIAISIAFFKIGRLLFRKTSFTAEQDWPWVYCGINYLVNWLPWLVVTRCTFLYHYLPSVIFSFLVLAWLITCWLEKVRFRRVAWISIALVTIAFVFWLPLYLGLPLSPQSWGWRLLLPTWR